jgi:hypothetical protein
MGKIPGSRGYGPTATDISLWGSSFGWIWCLLVRYCIISFLFADGTIPHTWGAVKKSLFWPMVLEVQSPEVWPSWWQSPEMVQSITLQGIGYACVCVSLLVSASFLKNHHDSIMGLPLGDDWSHPNHLPEAPPRNSIVQLSFYFFNISQWGLNLNTWILGEYTQTIVGTPWALI